MLYNNFNIKTNYVKIIAESYGFDFTSIDSLQAGFNRVRRFSRSELKTGIISNRESRFFCYALSALFPASELYSLPAFQLCTF